MATLPLGGRFYKSESLPISAQTCINLYLSRPQTTSPTRENLFRVPGITAATTAGTNVFNRGSHVFQSIPYFVNGDKLYRIDRTAGGVYSSVDVSGAETIDGSGRVIMSDNGAEGGQLCIVAPDETNQFNAWIYTVSGGLVQVSDGDFDGPVSTVNFVDGYFLFTKKDAQKFFISNLRDGTAYTATDFASAEADPDSIVGAFILHNEPYIFGSETVEPFQNIGGAGFPFQRVQGGVQRKGLKSKFAITQVNDVMYFLGAGVAEAPAMYMTEGGRPQKISTTAIETEISSYTDTVIENCFTWNYSDLGHEFAAFHFAGQNCFIFDISENEWHTRESVESENAIPSRIASVVEAYGVLLVGDLRNSNIGILDKENNAEYGVNLKREFVTPQLDNEGKPFWVNTVELWGESGIGLVDGENPQILMSASKNGGRSFEDPIPRGIGKIGEYDTRVIWNNTVNRVSREVCFKFETSDPVDWVFSKVEADFD